MKIATILPIPYLWLEKDSKYHLCLAHLMHRPEYQSFFTNRTSEEGNFVIMDNGVVETGVPMPIEKLMEIATDSKIHELILPDKIFDVKGTLKLGEKAIPVTQGSNLRLMAVPQGRTAREWLTCLREMVQWPVQTIGISKFVGKFFYNRYEALSMAWEDLIESDLDIHLLGCTSDPYEMNLIEQAIPGRIRGVDSGIAAMYTQAGKRMKNVPIRPKIEMDFNAQLDPMMLTDNVSWWKSRILDAAPFEEIVE